jgi:hypothetical protein
MGGWGKLCDITSDILPFREKDFIANYLSVCRTGVGDGSPLLGLTAIENLPGGFAAPEPKRIATGLTAHPLAGKLEYREHTGGKRLSHAAALAKRLSVNE